MPDNNDERANNPAIQPPCDRCLECGRPIHAETPHGVCSDCSLRNLLNTTFHQTGDFGSMPLIEHPEKDLTVDEHGQAKLVDPLSPGERIGPFEIVRRLGRGGMGTVYEAQDTENQRRVALNVLIRPVESDAARQRFLREGRLAASINHPNSVFVFGTHQIGRLSLISMELVEGGTLEQQVRTHGPMPTRDAVDAVLQIIAGLDAAYSRGILHRDIKPANCFEANDGTIKIGDFGLSISTDADFDARVTTEGTILGTPAFSSPEQLRGDALDVRSDIYALGVTLYFLIAGRTPYQAESLVKLLAQVFENSPPTPRCLRPEVSQELSQLVMQCLAKEPGDRFRTYAELRKALIPFSSQIPEAASLGWRTIAGLADWVVLGMFSLVYTALTSFASEPVLDSSYIASRSSVVFFTTLYIFYYALCESAFGRTVGKKLLGLWTICLEGGRPTFRQSLSRAAVFVLFPSMIVLPYNFFFQVGADSVHRELSWQTLGVLAVSFTYWCLWAVMFSTARSRNGLAGLHELVSHTRVVSRAFDANTHAMPAVTQPSTTSNASEIGPYQVLESLSTADGSEMHIAYDPLLLRRVWLRRDAATPDDTSDQYRTRLSRPTRLRWLNRVTDQSKVWDVYEAPTGGPLVDRLRAGNQPLEGVHLWLGDLVRELDAAIEDGTLPSRLSEEQLWLNESCRLKVLDFTAPGISEIEPSTDAAEVQTPPQRCQQLLRSLAPHLRAAITPRDSSTLPPPLYVTRMLSDWESGQDFDRVLQTTQAVSSRRPVSPKRRRLMMAAACYAFPVIQIVLLIAYQLLSGIFFANNDDIRQLRSLVMILQENAPFKNAWKFEELIAKNPALEPTLGEQLNAYHQYQAAAQLIAGEHRGILDDPRMKSIPAMMHLHPTLRQMIATVQADNQPSESEIAAASELLAVELQKYDRNMTMSVFSVASMALTISFLTWVGYTALPAMLAGLLFRGGLVVNGFQSALVRMNGNPAGRFRIFVRATLAAIPGVVALFLLMNSQARVFGSIHSHPNPMLVTVCVGIAIAGAIISNLFGNRSLEDRIMGTAVVAR